jgi:type 1 fimbria pilin
VRSIRLLAAILVLLWTTSAAAQDVTVSFSGTLTLVDSSPFPELTVGVPFSGSYT